MMINVWIYSFLQKTRIPVCAGRVSESCRGQTDLIDQVLEDGAGGAGRGEELLWVGRGDSVVSIHMRSQCIEEEEGV